MARLYQLLQDAVDGSGLTKGDFAEAVGLSRTSLFHILRGNSLPKRPTLDRILRLVDRGSAADGEILHVFETERLRTIKSRRKAVRSEQDMFKANVFSLLKGVCECRMGEARMPDLWVSSAQGDIPVFTEMRLLDAYNLLGRAQCVRAEAGRLDDPGWEAWACVSGQEAAYDSYQTMFAPFNLRIGGVDALADAFRSQSQQGQSEKVAGHFFIDISCD